MVTRHRQTSPTNGSNIEANIKKNFEIISNGVMYPVAIYKLKMLRTCLFQCCIVSLVITSTLATGTIARVKRCPTRAESKFVSQKKCTPPEVYHCLIDDEDKFVETCNEFIQLPPGYYPRYTSFSERIYYDPCPHVRYQPWPVKSYEITECEVEKSSCTGIGQVPCSDGNITEDATCSCDYKNGYVMTGPDKCCSPAGDDDCFCKYHPCQIDLQELDSDYNCVDKCNPGYYRPFGQNNCEHTQNSSYTPPTASTANNTTVPSLSVLVVLEFVVHDTFTVGPKIGVTLLVVTAVLGTVYVVYILSTHQIVKPRLTYDEFYEVQIYKLLKAASEGDTQMLQSLSNQRYIDMHDTDNDKRSALHLAACEGHFSSVEYLLHHNAGYTKAKDRCLCHTAAQDAEWHMKLVKNKEHEQCFKEIVYILRNHKSSQKDKHHFRDIVALKLIKSAENGELTELESLHEQGTDMNLSDSDGRTALHAAAEKSQELSINFLIDECKVSPFVRWRDQRPVQLIKDGPDKQNIIEKLNKYMKQQLDPESVFHMTITHEDEDLKTVRLLNSASRGDISRLRAYKAAGYKMTVSDYDRKTALHIAVSNNQEHVVEYLLKDCGLIDEANKTEDRWGRTPLMAAKGKGRGNIFKIFLKYCPNITNTENDEYKTFSLLMAGKKGEVKTLKRLYDSGVSMNMQDYDGRTALHLAVDEWKIEAMEYLIATCNCNMYLPDRYGYTAYDGMNKDRDRFRSFEDFKITRAAETLVSYGKKPQSPEEDEITETKDVKGKRFRVFSSQDIKNKKLFPKRNSAKSFTPKLKQQGVPPLVTDRSNMYLLYEAAAIGDVETMKKSEYPYFDVGDYIKNTPLHIAAAAGHLNVVRYLIEDCKVSPFIRDNEMRRPVDLVEKQIELLVSRAATSANLFQRKRFTDVRKKLKQEMTNIMNTHDTGTDSSFINFEKDVQIFMLLNKTYKGDIQSVKGYVESDRSIINQTDYDQRTALHIAVAENHEHLVRYFLRDLKDVIKTDIIDRWGRTPYKDAEENMFEEILFIFKDNGYTVDDSLLTKND
ncbi:unnamed protein product [Mytilus coruscus]|uniref:Uncharacterized protein n=1 Tax=Mytilus coruscus TaxID=42192 RepID=A0A6J8A3X1_MYTCO|nr:unnamed protein product [Mytilus coruscus]